MNAAAVRFARCCTPFVSSASAIFVIGCASPVPMDYVKTCQPAYNPARSCITTVPSAPRKLSINDFSAARVDAQCWWNRTGAWVETDAAYKIEVTHEVEPWVDSWIEASPERGWVGWAQLPGWFARWNARSSSAPMYALVGAVDKAPRSFFVVSAETPYRASASGELLLFANDWSSAYQNNKGCLNVTVTRTQ